MDVYLHIGSGKTGTSSIQRLMNRNRERLTTHGYLYPTTPGQWRHTRIGYYGMNDGTLARMPNWPRVGKAEPAEFRERFAADLRAELAAAGAERVVFSDEALFGLKPTEIERLRGLLEPLAERIHVIAYLRRQDDHVISRYQQVVKTGEIRPLDEYVAAMGENDSYDYRRKLNQWAERLEPASITVRRFERSAFTGGSLIHDFLAQIGLGDAADEFEEPEAEVNASLDADAVKFLRLWNVRRVTLDGATPRNMNNRKHIPTLSAHSTGPVLTLPGDVLDAWMDKWAESNREVARTYLGDESGVLFHDERRNRNVTTDPCLSARARERILRTFEVPLRAKNQLREVTEREQAR